MNTVTKIEREELVASAKKWRHDRMVKIKREGKLLGISHSWQYWVYNDTLYSIPSDGDAERVCIWCAMSVLKKHLIHLRSVTGRRWEDDLIIINKSLLPKY